MDVANEHIEDVDVGVVFVVNLVVIIFDAADEIGNVPVNVKLLEENNE